MKCTFLCISLFASIALSAHPRDAFTRVKSRLSGPGLVSNLNGRAAPAKHPQKRASYTSPYLNNITERKPFSTKDDETFSR
jgi:hypothetical protein